MVGFLVWEWNAKDKRIEQLVAKIERTENQLADANKHIEQAHREIALVRQATAILEKKAAGHSLAIRELRNKWDSLSKMTPEKAREIMLRDMNIRLRCIELLTGAKLEAKEVIPPECEYGEK